MNNGGILGFTWLVDPATHGLGCGDNSCKYVKPTGMATNGGCRCARNKPDAVQRFLLWNIAAQHAQLSSIPETIKLQYKDKV